MTTAYWWRGDERVGSVTNFGDYLTPILLQAFANVEVTWADAPEADIVCCGSVLDVLPREGWHGYVVGAGQLHDNTLTDLTFANVLGVRGLLTWARIKSYKPMPILGDPGLLVPELVTTFPNPTEIGVVPHWSDTELFEKEYDKALEGGYALPTLIDPQGDPLMVVKSIGSCRKIITSSLHGAITADAFGIPRRVESFPAMFADPLHEGNWFKWKDYASLLGQPVVFGCLQTAPKLVIDRLQYDLFIMFQQLEDLYA